MQRHRLTQRKGDGAWVLHLGSTATVQSARGVQHSLLKLLNKSGRLVVRLSPLKQVDSSFFQLLCAAHRQAMQQGADLQCEGPLTEEVSSAAKRYGLSEGCVCAHGGAACLWCGFDTGVKEGPGTVRSKEEI